MNNRPDPAEVLRLAEIVRAGENARAKLAAILDPFVKLEARHRKVPHLATSDAEQLLRIKLLNSALSWHPGKGTNLNSYLTICSRNALADVARKNNRTIGTSVDETALDMAVDESTLRPLDVDQAVKKRLSDLGKGSSQETQKLLAKLEPYLPSLAVYLHSKSEKNVIAIARQLIEIYQDVAYQMMRNKGNRAEVSKSLGISRWAIDIIVSDFKPKGKNCKWSLS